jgi:hypothetical protein
MGTKERAAILESNRKEAEGALGRFAQHGALLEGLQTQFNFNLDVAHQVYGDSLLHPDRFDETVKKWRALLQSVSEHPGAPLVFLKKYRRNQTVCTGFGEQPEYTTEVFAVRLPKVALSDFIYHAGEGEDMAYIAVQSDDAKTAGLPVGSDTRPAGMSRYTHLRLHAGEDSGSPNQILLAYRNPTSLISPEINVASHEITVLHDPSVSELFHHLGDNYIDIEQLGMSYS